MDKAHVKDIVSVLIQDPSISDNRLQLYLELGLLHSEYKQLDASYNLRAITLYDFFTDILHKWITKEGEDATVHQLLEVLKGCKLIQSHDSIAHKFPSNVQLIMNPVLPNPVTFTPIKFGIIPPVKNFAGRKELLHKIQDCVETNSSNLIAISGLGGVGKTELVRKFANDVSFNTAWMKGTTAMSLSSSLTEFAKELKITISKEDGIKETAWEICKQIQGKLLLVIDNLDEMHEQAKTILSVFLEKHDVFIIVTSRKPTVIEDEGILIELNELLLHESKALILSSKTFHSNKDTDDQLTLLCEKLWNFPLALQQSVSYIIMQRRGRSLKKLDYSILDYMTEYENKAKEMLSHKFSKLSNKYEETTFTTWNISMEQISNLENGKATLALLDNLAFLDPDGVGFEFLEILELSMTHRNKDFDKLKAIAEPMKVRKGIKFGSTLLERCVLIMNQYSLVFIASERTITMHRLVQKVRKIQLLDEGLLHFVLSVMANHAEKVVAENVLNFKLVNRKNLKNMAAIWDNIVEVKETDFLLFYQDLGFWICQKLFIIGKLVELASFSEGLQLTLLPHLEVGDEFWFKIIKQLVDRYITMGNYETVEKYSMQIYEELGGRAACNLDKIPMIMQIIVKAMCENGKVCEALEFLQNNKCEQSSPEFLSVHIGTSEILIKQESYNEAKQILLEVVRLQKEVLGEGYTRTIEAILLLAEHMDGLGDSTGAIYLLEITAATMSTESDYPASLYKGLMKARLALHYMDYQEFHQALLHLKTLITEPMLNAGSENKLISTATEQMGICYMETGLNLKAVEIFQSLYTQRTAQLGGNDEDSSRAISRLAKCKMRDFSMLAQLIEFFEMQRAKARDNSIWIAIGTVLAECLEIQKRYDEAENILKKILTAKEMNKGNGVSGKTKFLLAKGKVAWLRYLKGEKNEASKELFGISTELVDTVGEHCSEVVTLRKMMEDLFSSEDGIVKMGRWEKFKKWLKLFSIK